MSSSVSPLGTRGTLSALVGVRSLLAIVLLGAAGFGLWKSINSTATPLQSVPQVRQQVAVHALGRLEPAGKIVRLVPPSGNEGSRVSELLVVEGDDVIAGAIVARMDTYDRRAAELQEAEAQVKRARARLAQTRAGAKPGEIAAQQAVVDLLKEQQQVAQRDLTRSQTFRKQHALSDEDFERYQWNLNRTLLEYRKAVELLEAIKEVRVTDVEVQEAELSTAEAAVVSARVRLASSEVRTHHAGRILKIHSRAGEKVTDQGVLEMGDVLHMHAVAEVFESDVNRLHIGQAATIDVDGTGLTLSGTILELGHLVGRKVVLTNDPVSDTDARVVEVRVQLRSEDVVQVQRLSNARVEVSFLDENLD